MVTSEGKTRSRRKVDFSVNLYYLNIFSLPPKQMQEREGARDKEEEEEKEDDGGTWMA